jgi:type IV pilus assembly protein PilN
MIKVNLLKSRGGNTTTARSTGTDINYETSFDINATGNQSAGGGSGFITKILFMGIFVGGALAYESYNIGQLQSQLGNLTTQQSTLNAEIEQKKPIAEKARTMQKEILDLEAKIQGIKGLSKIRLREIKAIDFIQNVIPEKVWLTRLNFENDKLTLEGAALADDQLNKFTDALEGKSYFRNVILLKAIERKSTDGTMKIFEISSGLTTTE